MAQHPFLKSIRPVNLLSFGPNTEEIELRPLNILIGPNGSGKSNFIEVIRLLHYLPDKDPWTVVLETGGVSEWIWKGKGDNGAHPTLQVNFYLGDVTSRHTTARPRQIGMNIDLERFGPSFRVSGESLCTIGDEGGKNALYSWFERHGTLGEIHQRFGRSDGGPIRFDLHPDRSVLSLLSTPQLQAYGVGQSLPDLYETAEFFQKFDFHQDWEFGTDLPARAPIAVGQPTDRLEEGGYNLAQMLAYCRDYDRPVFARIQELMKQFYEPFGSLDVRLIGTHLQVAVQETGGFSTPAYRLSDGTLRWLALLAVLLNPTPAPLTCIDEPELGLHPDTLPTLADLLVEASARTQLIVTTHSRSFIDAFTETPEAVCTCEKVDGSTVIQRLEGDRLKVWLDEYSLGKLWTSGEIGGNRW